MAPSPQTPVFVRSCMDSLTSSRSNVSRQQDIHIICTPPYRCLGWVVGSCFRNRIPSAHAVTDDVNPQGLDVNPRISALYTRNDHGKTLSGVVNIWQALFLCVRFLLSSFFQLPTLSLSNLKIVLFCSSTFIRNVGRTDVRSWWYVNARWWKKVLVDILHRF